MADQMETGPREVIVVTEGVGESQLFHDYEARAVNQAQAPGSGLLQAPEGAGVEIVVDPGDGQQRTQEVLELERRLETDASLE